MSIRNPLLILFIFLYHLLGAQSKISTGPWQQLVPSAGLPKEVKVQQGNNNIDAVRYRDRYYVAFRTAPNHFASRKTHLYIMSTKDLETWDHEATFFMNSDMREPRFLVYQDNLYFYYFMGGNKFWKFEPKKLYMSQFQKLGQWSQIRDLGMDGYVPWRFRVRNDTIYMSAYYGVDIYNHKHEGALKLFRSTNAIDFEPISEGSQIPTKGGEEGEFEFDAAGNLWATVRLEGSGSYVAYADKDSLQHWRTWFSKQKYDSALMLNHRETFYVFARRHLKGDATKVEQPSRRQRRRNLIRYSLSKKRTAMYRLDKAAKRLIHVMDFPSTGDTAFPAIAKVSDTEYLLFNYSNDIRKKDRNWIGGQLRATNIYWTLLTID